MRRTLVCVLMLLPLALVAQQPVRPSPSPEAASTRPSRTDVLKFLAVMRVRERMEDVRRMALVQARQSVRDLVAEEMPKATPDQINELEGMVDRMVSGYTIQNTLDDMIPIYQKHLTKADIDAVTAFFSSPAGRHFLDNEPLITNEALQLVTSKTQAQVEATMAAINKRLDEMKGKKQE